MARPSFETIFGFGSGYVAANAVVPESGIFIPEGALRPEGGFDDGPLVDPQQWFWMLLLEASRTLNEANRNNDLVGIATTLTYGSYDSIIDPPGSQSVYRRDVFSAIAYRPQVYAPFEPESV